ncbi:sialate O-acetylesterase [Prosthecobacter sp.]|jgi:hypothetical protein|uniref:sialate O-acetylesterase n=1 Tax=Prosthecobacter sp. TaxID=1965333 RepID=UPI00378390F8
MKIALLAALLLASLAALHADEPPLVIILSGQSNMAGYGKAAELSNEWRTPPPNVSLIHWGRQQPLAHGQIGPEVTLAHALARGLPGRKIVLFKAAHGGTSQLVWQPQHDEARIARLKLNHDQRAGHAYAQLIAAWKKAFPNGGIKPAALLWMQGESDARVPELAKDYQQHLTNLIASLRRDLDAPQMKAVIAEINPAKVTPVSPFPCVDEVRAAQRAIPAKDPLTVCISTDGLTKASDQVHYDTAGQQGLGLRFAEALQTLLAKDAR